MHVSELQAYSVKTCAEVFGHKNMTDKRERLLRFAEEAVELLRAGGLTYEELCATAAHEYYERQPGEVSQEVAGAQTTLFGLANVFGVDVETVSLKEIDRVLSNKEKIRAKHNLKPNALVAQRVA